MTLRKCIRKLIKYSNHAISAKELKNLQSTALIKFLFDDVDDKKQNTSQPVKAIDIFQSFIKGGLDEITREFPFDWQGIVDKLFLKLVERK